jgi:FMN phosphatase YigB (HAD superfamily)
MAADAAIRAAVFDIGATLVTGPPVAPNKVIAGLLKGVTAAEVASVIMTQPFESADQACAALESQFGSICSEARSGIGQLWQSQSSAATALDGAEEVVCNIKRSGMRIGLLSDIWSPYYASVEKALPQVIEAADAIVLSCRTGCRKPEPANFRTVLHDLDVTPEEAIMIGDTYEHDILPAIRLGMQTVWVLCRPDREAESLVRILNGELPAPAYTVRDIREVLSIEGLTPHPQPLSLRARGGDVVRPSPEEGGSR